MSDSYSNLRVSCCAAGRGWLITVLFLLLVPLPTSAASEAEEASSPKTKVTIELHGLASFVVGDQITVLFPNLIDVRAFMDNRMRKANRVEMASHQLRIFVVGGEITAEDQPVASLGYPCHGEFPSPVPMIDWSGWFPFSDWKIVLKGVEKEQSDQALLDHFEEGLLLPKIQDHLRTSSDSRFDESLLTGWELLDQKLLIARLQFPDEVSRGDLETSFFPCPGKIGGKEEKFPKSVRWRGSGNKEVKVVLESEQAPNVTIKPTGENLLILIEHSPPKVHGRPCDGGSKDFVAHFNLVNDPPWWRWRKAPVLLCETGLRPGIATNPQCSPAEQTGGP